MFNIDIQSNLFRAMFGFSGRRAVVVAQQPSFVRTPFIGDSATEAGVSVGRAAVERFSAARLAGVGWPEAGCP